ncbi:MAG: RluA family pseudouridine synthase [Armatimonadetes bacterium]|nr:RluA family pseudouridine synthase [Armatimonadota bacterium]
MHPAVSEIEVSQQEAGRRLDAFVAAQIPELSRSAAERLVASGHILIGGRPAKPSYKVRPGERVTVSVPPPEPTEILPEAIPLDILYEDSDLVVINKPRGMVVHPAAGAHSGTLVNAVLAHCDDLSGIGGEERPGIVHRLDKDTSGVMVVAKSDRAHRDLARQIQARSAKRRYHALLWGDPAFETRTVEAAIGRHPVDRKKMAVLPELGRLRSRPALTEIRILERFGDMALAEARLQTGRTHQIRVHTAHIGHPVVGDPVYGGAREIRGPGRRNRGWLARLLQRLSALEGQMLHAHTLTFFHPVTGEEMSFSAPMPEDMASLLRLLREGADL